MRLHSYIINEGRSKELSWDDTVTTIKKNCLDSLSAFLSGKATIYRGNSSLRGQYGIIDPTKGKERKSTFNDSNHYTILFDNLPSWKAYPRRARSVIATTNENNANHRGTGQTYIVLPYDNAKIAVCPADDMWFSFRKSLDGDSLSDLNSWFRKSSISDEKSKMITRLKDIIKDDYNDIDPNDIFGPPRWTVPKVGTSLWDHFNKILNPRDNGFEILRSGDKLPYDREIWTESKCILLRNNGVTMDELQNTKWKA